MMLSTLLYIPKNDRSCLGPRETCYSGPEGAVLHEKATGGV